MIYAITDKTRHVMMVLSGGVSLRPSRIKGTGRNLRGPVSGRAVSRLPDRCSRAFGCVAAAGADFVREYGAVAPDQLHHDTPLHPTTRPAVFGLAHTTPRFETVSSRAQEHPARRAPHPARLRSLQRLLERLTDKQSVFAGMSRNSLGQKFRGFERETPVTGASRRGNRLLNDAVSWQCNLLSVNAFEVIHSGQATEASRLR
jgi:hypothetical protein